MKTFMAALYATLLASCASGENPELACQQRLDGAANVIPPGEDSFGAEAYAKLDRSGCTARQLAVLDQLTRLASELPGLNAANEKAAASGDKAAHSAAFQRMNDALIALNDLQQSVRRDLAQLEQPQ